MKKRLFKKLHNSVVLLGVIFVFCTTCMLTGCYSSRGMQNTIVTSVHNSTLKGKDKDRHTALLLLSMMELTYALQQSLVQQFNTTNSGLDRLLLAFVLYSRTQEEKYAQAFVSEYPLGKGQSVIWDFIDTGTYFIGTSPVVQMLAYLSYSKDEALIKLISGWPFADGRHAEMLQDYIEELLAQDPARVQNALEYQGISYP